MNRNKFSDKGDLNPLAKDIEAVFRWHFEMEEGERPAI